jgi:hypothetical protein
MLFEMYAHFFAFRERKGVDFELWHEKFKRVDFHENLRWFKF